MKLMLCSVRVSQNREEIYFNRLFYLQHACRESFFPTGTTACSYTIMSCSNTQKPKIKDSVKSVKKTRWCIKAAFCQSQHPRTNISSRRRKKKRHELLPSYSDGNPAALHSCNDGSDSAFAAVGSRRIGTPAAQKRNGRSQALRRRNQSTNHAVGRPCDPPGKYIRHTKMRNVPLLCGRGSPRARKNCVGAKVFELVFPPFCSERRWPTC